MSTDLDLFLRVVVVGTAALVLLPPLFTIARDTIRDAWAKTREDHLQRIADDARCTWRADTDTWERR